MRVKALKRHFKDAENESSSAKQMHERFFMHPIGIRKHKSQVRLMEISPIYKSLDVTIKRLLLYKNPAVAEISCHVLAFLIGLL